MKKITVNIVSESDISVQGHGVHTAYVEMARALEARDDIEVIRGGFGKLIDCDVVHIHSIGSRVWRKLFQKGPVKVVSAHVVSGSFVGSLVGAKLWKGLANVYLRWFYNRADLLIAVSSATADELRNLSIKTPIKVIDNSIDTSIYSRGSNESRLKIRKKLGIPSDAFVVIGAGQVQPRKRVDSFIKAANECSDIEFIWVGGMPFGALAADHRAMQLMMDSAPKNVHFPGIVGLDEMPSFYHAADIFWLPSMQETFGLVVVEAAASGLPVILRDIPDYKTTFAQYAVVVDDSSDVEAIRKLQYDPDYYQNYKSKAAELAGRFDSKVATDKLVVAYKDLITNSKSSV